MNDVVTVKSPEGDLGTVSKQELSQVLRRGFTVPTNDEISAHNDKIEYGSGVANPLKAFGEAAAGTATFGASRELENKLGITTPEAQAARAKYNPVARTLGDVAGVAAPLVGEASGLVKAGTMFNPVARVAELGTAAGETAAKLVPEAGLAQSVLRQGAQGAAEGAIYGAGQTVSEHALGDPDVNGEKLLSNVGFGSLLGGAIGGGLGAAEVTIPKALNIAGNALTKAKNVLIGAEDEVGPLGKIYAKGASFVSGKAEESILEALRSRSSIMDNPEEREQVASHFSSSLNEHFNAINEALSKANAGAREEEVKALLKEIPAEQAIQQSAHIGQSIEATLKDMTDRAPLYPSSVPYKLQGLRDEFLKKIGGAESAADVYEHLNWFKKQIDDKFPIWGKMIPPEWKDAVSALKGLRTEIKQNLENESIWGEAGARQSAFNDAQNRFLTTIHKSNDFAKGFLGKSISRTGRVIAEVNPSKVKTFLSQVKSLRSESKAKALDEFFNASEGLVNEIKKTSSNAGAEFDQEAISHLARKNQAISEKAVAQADIQKNLNALGAGGHNAYLGEAGALAVGVHNPLLGAAIEGINVFRNPGLTVQRLAKIEAAVKKTTDLILKSAKAVFRTGVKSGEKVSGFLGTKAHDDFDNKKEKINKFTQDYDHALNMLDKSTNHIYASAPEITGSLHQTTIRGAQFLAAKIPKTTDSFFGKDSKPSPTELAKFDRYYQAVQEPVSIMKLIRNAAIMPEHIETLSAVYPKLYNEMKSEVMGELSYYQGIIGKGTIPYKTRMGLSQFMAEPLDESLRPQSVMANQAILSAPPPPEGGAPKKRTNSSALAKVDVSSRFGLHNLDEA